RGTPGARGPPAPPPPPREGLPTSLLSLPFSVGCRLPCATLRDDKGSPPVNHGFASGVRPVRRRNGWRERSHEGALSGPGHNRVRRGVASRGRGRQHV